MRSSNYRITKNDVEKGAAEVYMLSETTKTQIRVINYGATVTRWNILCRSSMYWMTIISVLSILTNLVISRILLYAINRSTTWKRGLGHILDVLRDDSPIGLIITINFPAKFYTLMKYFKSRLNVALSKSMIMNTS